MVELQYGARGFARLADKEIGEGRPVLLLVHGWQRRIVHRTMSLYAERTRLGRVGQVSRAANLKLLLHVLLAPNLIGLCQHAREKGMQVTVLERGAALEVRFEKIGV